MKQPNSARPASTPLQEITGRASADRARFVGRLLRIDYLEHELAEGGLLGLLHEIHCVRWRPVLLRDVFEGDRSGQTDFLLDLHISRIVVQRWSYGGGGGRAAPVVVEWWCGQPNPGEPRQS